MTQSTDYTDTTAQNSNARNTEIITESQRDNAAKGLKDIINYVVDSINGYHKGVELVRDDEPELADYFQMCADKRTEKRDELIRILNQFEAQANDSFDGTTSGSLHQSFTSFRSLFQSDRKAALAEIERGEDYLADQYEDLLEKSLPETVVAVLRRHHQDIERREEMAEDLLKAS